MKAERLWCMGNVYACTDEVETQFFKYDFSHHSTQDIKTKNSSTNLDQFHQYNPGGDLTCPICKVPFTKQFQKMMYMVGGIGMFFSIIEAFVSFTTYKYSEKEKIRRTEVPRQLLNVFEG